MKFSEHIQLVEGRLDFLWEKYKLALKRTESVSHDVLTARRLFDNMVELDPSRNNAYTEWLLQMAIGDTIKYEDWYKVGEYLYIYDKIKAQLPIEERQINRIRDIGVLFKIIEPYTEKVTQERDAVLDTEMRKEADVLLDNEAVLVVVPNTMKSSCYFGVGTQWCTAHENEAWNRFEHYNDKGKLYIIIFKGTNKKYQLHFDNNEFMDQDDVSIEMVRYPEMTGLEFPINQDKHRSLLHILGTDDELFTLFQGIFKRHSQFNI